MKKCLCPSPFNITLKEWLSFQNFMYLNHKSDPVQDVYNRNQICSLLFNEACVIVALHLKFNYTFSCVRSLVKKRSNCNFLNVWLSGVFHHQGHPSIMRIRFLSWAISYYCSVFLRLREYNSCWMDQRGTFGESICISSLHCFSNVDVHFCNCDEAEWRKKKNCPWYWTHKNHVTGFYDGLV